MKRALRLFLLCLSMVTILTSCGKQETVINSIDDAKEKKIGVMTGSIGETLAHSRFPKAEIKSFDDIMDAVAAIKSGQLDVIITMFPAALQVAKKNPDLRILPERLENEDTAVAIKKEDTALQADVDRVISELKADGTLESMHKRWLKTDLSPYEELTLALPKEGKPLKIGVSATREPFSFVDENGRVTGFDGELARLIGVGLQRPVEFFNMKFMALIPALQSGKVDLIISGMNATPERRKSVAFSQTYFANAQVMLARKPTGAVEQTAAASMSASTSTADGSDELAKIQQSEGKRIGVMTGTTSEATAIIKFPKADIKRFDDITSAITAMKSGQADAVIQPFSSAVLVTKKHPDLHSLPDQLYIEDIAIAIRKGNSHLLNEVNSSIAALKNDGTLASMKKRWLKEDTTPYEEINITVPQSGNVLKIGVSAVLEPFIFVDASGKITGHDIELARRIAAKLKRPVEIVDMKFMALIPALQSGKIDMIVSSMTATDERRKSVDFSQPYFADAQVLTTKKAAAAQAVVPQASDTVSPGEVISELRHINGKRVGVLTGSAGDHAARKRFPNASIMDMNASADAALAIKSNKADAFVYDKSVLLNLAEKNPELFILEEPVAKLEVAAAIKKDNKALLADMNRVLSDLKKDGTLQRLQKKWIESKDGAQRQLPPTATTPVKGVLRLGTSAIIEPFSYQANGKIIGLDIELGNLIGERLGKRVEIFDMQFESLIPALHSGKIDFAMSNFNVTEERKKLVNFSLPYIENDISALVRRGKTSDAATTSPKPIIAGVPDGSATSKLATVNDLKEKRIGVLLGSEHDSYITRTYPNATVLQYKSPSDILLAVKSGKVDAGVYTRETLMGVLRSDNELGLVGDSLYSVPIAMGFRKGDNQMREQFNAFLRQIRTNGVFADMVDRWMTKEMTSMPKIANPKPKGVLVVGMVSDKGMPFAMMKDNKLIGLDIELVQRFGAYLGKEVRFADMEFGSLIAAVSTSKVDMVASTLMITEERKKQIDFSDIYYEMGSNVFALKKNIAVKETAAETRLTAPTFLQGVAESFQSNIITEKRYLLIWDGLKVTFLISILSSIFGTLLGALVCYMRMSKSFLLNQPAKIYISVLRGTPVLVLLMLIFYVAFASININPVLVAVIAFGMNFAAYAAEIFRAGIENVDKGQTEAGIAMGFTKVNTFLFIVLPQAVRQILPVYKGEFISLVKMTSIVGYIAVQDLTKASDIIRSRTFDAFFPLFMVAILYFLISWILTQSLEYLERATDPKRKRKQAGKA